MRPASILCLLFVVNGCRAGIQIHDPKNLQETNTLFNWVKNMGHDGKHSTLVVDREYYVTNMVAMCPLNVLFVLDGSDSVSPNGFELARSALVREIERVYNAFANTDIGVIMFSDTTVENDVLKLQSRTSSELQYLIQEVRGLKQPRRKTALPVAVKRARQELLDYSMSNGRLAYDGYRGGGLMVLITDGVPDNQRATIQEAKLASDNHIVIISVSIENANQKLLRDISNVVVEYRTPIDWPSSVACPATVLPPVKSQDCNDFLLITDGSDSVLRYKETVRQFLAYTALRFKYDTNRIGVKLFATDSSTQKRETMIRPMSDKHALAEAIREKLIFPRSGGTGTDIAINQAVEMLKDDPRPRRITLVLITDGPPLNPDAVRQAIQNAVNNNYQVVIIRVGTVLTDQMLQRMAGSGNSIYSVNDFTGLYSVDFSKDICLGGRQLRCTAPMVLDANGICVCPNQCLGGAQLDAQCRCQCPNANRIYSAGSCICRNTGICGANQVRNQQTCQCETRCTNQCPQYSIRTAQCDCVCQSGRVKQGNQCVCSTRCPADARLNNLNCECQCTNVNKIFQFGSCVCRDTGSCGVNQVRNQQTCQCETRCTNQCPQYSIRTAQCDCVCQSGRVKQGNQCVCSTRCPADARLNNLNCGCQCTNVNKVYQFGSCVCRDTARCGVNQVRNQQTCQCETRCTNQCPQYSIRNDQCDCICQSGRVMQGNQCVCSTRCPADARLNNLNCGCQCTNVNKIFQFGSCVCRDTGRCGANQVRNQQTCQCETRCTNQCPQYSTRNDQCDCICQSGRGMQGNQCVCSTRCPADARVNNVNCGCQCTNVNKVFRFGSCVCRDAGSCGVNQVRNQQTCQCETRCTNQCPQYSIRNAQCDCICQSGRVMQGNQCVCSTRCPADARVNNVNCGCQCTNVNKIYRLGSCVCRDAGNCGANQVRNQQTCQCESRCTNQCPLYSTRNDQCDCICQSGRVLQGNQCVCSTRCPADARVNNVNCGCQCTNVNKVFRFGSCVCRDAGSCGANQVRNQQTCQCESRCTNQCPLYSTRNDQCDCICQSGRVLQGNQCVCSTRCPADARVDNVNCGCQCTNVNKVFRFGSCVCRDAGSCGVNQVRNQQTCQCETRCTNQCPQYSIRNAQCDCICQSGRVMQGNQCVCSTRCPADARVNNVNCGCQCTNVNKIYRLGSCVCRDAGSCGVNQVRNQQTCQCETRCTNQCPQYSIRNAQCDCICQSGRVMQGNQCVCSTRCPADARVNNVNCGCQCTNANKIYRLGSCVCRNAGSCGVNQVRNQQTCQCETRCTNQCPQYSIRNAQCDCVCQSGRVMQGNQCVCSTRCPADARVNNVNCGCQCTNVNKVFRFGSCVCRDAGSCGVNQVRNQQTCQCETRCTNQCPQNSIRNAQCDCVCQSGRVMQGNQCVCSTRCPADARVNNLECGCQCTNVNKVYQFGSCVCSNAGSCGFNQVRNQQTCQCEARCTNQCPPLSTRNAQCDCVCPSGRVLQGNQCVCSTRCPADARVNNLDCGCQCTNVNKVYQFGSCVCRDAGSCGVNQVRNQQTCQCESRCTNQCPLYSTRNGQCDCVCDSGRVMQNNQCVSPPQSGCPGLSCFNNQKAVRDCKGNCYCSCGAGYAGDQCEIKISAELCDDCEYSNGHYQAGVKGSCHLFVTCLPANGEPADGRIRPTSFTPVIQNCAPGTLYTTRPDGWRGCDHPGLGVCEQDMCATLPSYANYTDNNSCRSYWTCGDRRTMGRRCCPPGTGYDPRSGQCTPGTNCVQRCPMDVPDCSGTGTVVIPTRPACNIGRNPNNFNEWFYLTNPANRFNCKPGFEMNIFTCGCVLTIIDKGQPKKECTPKVALDFESVVIGELRKIVRTQVPGHTSWVADLVTSPDFDIIFKQFSGSGFYNPYFEIDVKIKVEGQVSGNGKTAVVTNADCNVDDSVSITMDRQNFYFRVSLEGSSSPIIISIPYAGRQDADGFYILKLVYIKDRSFSGTVGTYTETYSGPMALSGVIGFRKCAVHLGRGFGYERFVGYVDDVYIWTCNPNA